MLESPIFNVNYNNLTFDFEEYIKNELGLNLEENVKKEGKNQHFVICVVIKHIYRGTYL